MHATHAILRAAAPRSRSAVAHGALAALALALALASAGCFGGKAAPNDASDAATPSPARRALPADQPLILVASLGENPNIVSFNILNQTDRDCPMSDRFFGLILRGQRRPRPYQRGIDWAHVGSAVIPAGGQAVGVIEWGRVPPLAGHKLVFNPEGTGFPPVIAVIERVIVVPAEDEAGAGGAAPSGRAR